VRHERNLGEEEGIQTGFKHMLSERYKFVVKMDADGQHRPEDVMKIINALRRGVDFVIGRGQANYEEPLLFKAGRKFCAVLLSALMGRKIGDPTSGFNGFSQRCFLLLRKLHEAAGFFKNDLTNNIERLLLIGRAGLRICEVPLVIHKREAPSKCYFSDRLLLFPVLLVLTVLKCLSISPRVLRALYREGATPSRVRVEGDGHITSDFTRAFEAEFTMLCGVELAVAVNSGTGALEVAQRCLGLRPGDGVLAPTNTFTAI